VRAWCRTRSCRSRIMGRDCRGAAGGVGLSSRRRCDGAREPVDGPGPAAAARSPPASLDHRRNPEQRSVAPTRGETPLITWRGFVFRVQFKHRPWRAGSLRGPALPEPGLASESGGQAPSPPPVSRVRGAVFGARGGGRGRLMVLPAPPDHMQPGPGHDPHGVRLAVPAGAGLLVKLRGTGVARDGR
jgi:hypothetical protein